MKTKTEVQNGFQDEMVDVRRKEDYIEDKKEEMVNTGIPEFTEEQKEYARMNVRTEFNKKFSKWATIADENATDEDIEKAKADFNAAVDETKARTYTLATAEGRCALRAAEILMFWNKTMNVWGASAWRGVIAFNKFIEAFIEASDETKDLVVDYNTLVFLHQQMQTPYGIGVQAAFDMAEMENFDTEKNEVREEEYPVTYSGILEKVNTEVAMLSNIDKKLTILRERVNLAYAGLRMDLKISELEEFIEFNDAMVHETVANESAE